MIEWLILIFIIIGLMFNFLGVFGLLRFPDVYTRLHAATKCTTFGSIFLILAIALYAFGQWYHIRDNIGMMNMGVHAIFALLALLFTNPTGAHAIARAAHKSGIEPVGAVIDQLADDESGVKVGTVAEGDDVEEEVSDEGEEVDEEKDTGEGGEQEDDNKEEEEASDDGEESSIDEDWGVDE